MYARYAPLAKTIRFATVAEFDAATWTQEDVSLVLVEMTTAELEAWEWVTDTLTPTGQAPSGTKVYEQVNGRLLGIMLTVGSGYHVEAYDAEAPADFSAVPFPGRRGTARREPMALQQMYNARVAAARRARVAAEREWNDYLAAEVERAAEADAAEYRRRLYAA